MQYRSGVHTGSWLGIRLASVLMLLSGMPFSSSVGQAPSPAPDSQAEQLIPAAEIERIPLAELVPKAQGFAKEGSLGKATQLYRAYLAKRPDDLAARSALALVFLQAGDLESALRETDEVLKKNAQVPEAH